MQVNLNQVYVELDMLEKLPSASAYCHARKKIKPELFKELNNSVVNNFYRLYDAKTFKGNRVLSVDCSCINLPNESEIIKKYGTQRGAYFEQAEAFGSFLYDSLNEITINTELARKKAEKEFIFNDHIKYLKNGDILLLDRCYSDYSVLAFAISKNINFVIRFPISGRFKALNDFMVSEENEIILDIGLTSNQKGFVLANGLPEKVTLRFVKIDIGGDEPELLCTNMFDISVDELKWLYHQRWGIETYFDRLKNFFEIERFSSKSVSGIEQDFFGIVLLTNLETVLIQDAQEEVTTKTSKRKNRYKVNRSISYATILDYLVFLFLNNDDYVYDKINLLLETNPVIIRPGRSFPRKKMTPSQKLRYNLYQKRIRA